MELKFITEQQMSDENLEWQNVPVVLDSKRAYDMQISDGEGNVYRGVTREDGAMTFRVVGDPLAEVVEQQ